MHSHVLINICAQAKNPEHLHPYHCFGHRKTLHTLTGPGSAAFAAAVLYPGKTTRISRKGQRSTEKQTTKKPSRV